MGVFGEWRFGVEMEERRCEGIEAKGLVKASKTKGLRKEAKLSKGWKRG